MGNLEGAAAQKPEATEREKREAEFKRALTELGAPGVPHGPSSHAEELTPEDLEGMLVIAPTSATVRADGRAKIVDVIDTVYQELGLDEKDDPDTGYVPGTETAGSLEEEGVIDPDLSEEDDDGDASNEEVEEIPMSSAGQEDFDDDLSLFEDPEAPVAEEVIDDDDSEIIDDNPAAEF
jgi:hypothetical protein